MSGIILPGDAIPLLEAIHRAAVTKAAYAKRSVGRRVDPIDKMLYEFMAEILPDEGLDIYLGQFPKNDTRITTLSLCLFSSQSASTVITGSQTVANITESTW